MPPSLAKNALNRVSVVLGFPSPGPPPFPGFTARPACKYFRATPLSRANHRKPHRCAVRAAPPADLSPLPVDFRRPFGGTWAVFLQVVPVRKTGTGFLAIPLPWPFLARTFPPNSGKMARSLRLALQSARAASSRPTPRPTQRRIHQRPRFAVVRPSDEIAVPTMARMARLKRSARPRTHATARPNRTPTPRPRPIPAISRPASTPQPTQPASESARDV